MATPMKYGDRFVPMSTTPRQMTEMLDSDQENILGIKVEGEVYSTTKRFDVGLAHELKVPFGVFGLFSPDEVLHRAAELQPDLPLRMTLDLQKKQVLGLAPDQGLPMPVKYIENVLNDDRRVQSLTYDDGRIVADLDMNEAWEVPNDSEYRMHVRCRVPVDGMGEPDLTLSTLRQVCVNGAVAEAPIFRTRMQIKDNSGDHFRRLLNSFSNPAGVEALQQKLLDAAATHASVGELVTVEGLVRKSVPNTRNEILLRERLHEIAGDPCVRYGVTDLQSIGEKRRALLPVDCSVSDLLNFVSELGTHHAELLEAPKPLHAFTGTMLAKGFDLEGLYPCTAKASQFYLNGIKFAKAA